MAGTADLLGAWLGDISSYLIGRRCGPNVIRRFIKTGAKRRVHYQRARKLLLQHTGKTLFTARITGPIAKLTPFLAGAMHISFSTMAAASLFGAMIGTAQFIAAGWFLVHGVNYWDSIKQFAAAHIGAICTISSIILAAALFLRQKRHS